MLALRLITVVEGHTRHGLVQTSIGDRLYFSILLDYLPLFPLLEEEDCQDGDDEKEAESANYPADYCILYSGF
jgi:hypothetical protein